MSIEDDNVLYFTEGNIEELVKELSSIHTGSITVDLCERTLKSDMASCCRYHSTSDFFLTRPAGLVLRNGTLKLGGNRMTIYQLPAAPVSKTSSRRSSMESTTSVVSSRISADMSSCAVSLGLISVDHFPPRHPADEAHYNDESPQAAGSSSSVRVNRNRRLSNTSDASSYKLNCIKMQNIKICGDTPSIYNDDRGSLLSFKGGHLVMEKCQVYLSSSKSTRRNLPCSSKDQRGHAVAAVEVYQGGALHMSECQISNHEGGGLRVTGLGSSATLFSCTLDNCAGAALHAQAGANLRVSNSVLKGSAHDQGIYVQGSGTRLTARACKLMGCKVQGVLVRESARCELLNCSVMGGEETGAEVQGSKSRLTMYDSVIRGCMGDGMVIKDGAWAHIEGADLEVNQGRVGVHVMGYGSSVSLSSSLLVSKAGHAGLLVEGGGHAEIKDSTIDCRHSNPVEISSQAAANWGVLGNHSKARSPPLVVTGTRSMLMLGEEVEVYGMGIDLKESLLVCEGGQVQGQLIEVPVFAPSQEFKPHSACSTAKTWDLQDAHCTT